MYLRKFRRIETILKKYPTTGYHSDILVKEANFIYSKKVSRIETILKSVPTVIHVR